MSKEKYIKNLIDDMEIYFNNNYPSYGVHKTDNTISVHNDHEINKKLLSPRRKNLAYSFDKEIFDILKAQSDDINYWTTFKCNVVDNKLTIL